MSLIIALLAVVLILLVYRIFRYKHIISRIPSPKGLPIVGLAAEILQDDSVALFNRFRKYAKDHKGIYRISLMFYDIIQIYNAEDAEQILKGNIHQWKGYDYEILENWLGTGLLTSVGEKWRTRRKLLTPAFHFQILQEFLICFNEETRRFVKDMNENIDQCQKDIKPCVISFTMKTICETAMGLDDIDESNVVDYKIKMKKYVDIIIKRTQQFWNRIPFIYNLTAEAKREQSLVSDMHKFSRDIIINRMKKRSGSTIKRKRVAMLDLLLNSKETGEQIDMEGIQEEVDTFVFAEKAREEVENIFQGEDRDCSLEDLSKLEYLECCIKETLRIYPSVPLISRRCSENYTTATGYQIPEGTIMTLHIFDLHRDPKIYPDPEKFDPERFTAENSKNRPPFAFIPFSGGPRNCIGQKYAMLEMKTFFCGILRNFKLEAIDKPEDLIFEVDFVLSTKNPIRVRFVKI
ncbi:hypothetical protein WA026_006727 [Henosepilachna vigintioctopunctata]|uniref:Cytochrome P450 n=1 Tax=Henosepilachna vigintioctopunctata TaxID=420089 RepID=A0AAW1UHR1_9CUCU